MAERSAADIVTSLHDVVTFDIDGDVQFRDLKRLRSKHLDPLVWDSVFHSDPETKAFCRWLIRTLATGAGVVPASIAPFYKAKGKGNFGKMTVPAFNLRGLTYDLARAAFRAAISNGCGAMIFELARSEMKYTDQSPDEYATVVIAAGFREGFTGPVFLQGDHFQFNAQKMAQDPISEIKALEELTRQAVSAGFYNIDIDASTLVDLRAPIIEAQQQTNVDRTFEMIRLIRSIEPEGISISIGGEIGEVGGKNSTVDELRAYLDGLISRLKAEAPGMEGVSKISVQSGTTHGGIPLPDGKIADVAIDFRALEDLSKIAVEAYHLAGVVQHGASTLPESAFDHFPQSHTAEIHLATAFQNLLFDSKHFPKALYQEIQGYLLSAHASERKPDQTDEQFLYTTRKKAFGPMKRKLWEMPESVREAIGAQMEIRFDLLMKKLGVDKTIESIVDTVPVIKALKPVPEKFGALVH